MPASPMTIALILSPITIDCADVLVTTSAESAAALLSVGWDLSGAPYDIAVCFGDREAAEAILGRKLTRKETSALEACIRAPSARRDRIATPAKNKPLAPP